jgi:hypothetical protein
MDILTLLFALATFIAVVLFLEGGYLWWASNNGGDKEFVVKGYVNASFNTYPDDSES